MLDWFECAIRAMWKNGKLTSDSGDSGKKKCKLRLWWHLWYGLAQCAFGGIAAFIRNLA